MSREEQIETWVSFGQTCRREGLDHSLKGRGLMAKVMDSGFLRVDEK
jgi:hypothetical protein